MTESLQEPDGPLSLEQAAAVAQLTQEQIDAIDRSILAHANTCWRKVAFVVGSAMTHPERVRGVPDIYYAQRVANLVGRGVLQSAGNLEFMGYSEVRLADARVDAT